MGIPQVTSRWRWNCGCLHLWFWVLKGFFNTYIESYAYSPWDSAMGCDMFQNWAMIWDIWLHHSPMVSGLGVKGWQNLFLQPITYTTFQSSGVKNTKKVLRIPCWDILDVDQAVWLLPVSFIIFIEVLAATWWSPKSRSNLKYKAGRGIGGFSLYTLAKCPECQSLVWLGQISKWPDNHSWKAVKGGPLDPNIVSHSSHSGIYCMQLKWHCWIKASVWSTSNLLILHDTFFPPQSISPVPSSHQVGCLFWNIEIKFS